MQLQRSKSNIFCESVVVPRDCGMVTDGPCAKLATCDFRPVQGHDNFRSQTVHIFLLQDIGDALVIVRISPGHLLQVLPYLVRLRDCGRENHHYTSEGSISEWLSNVPWVTLSSDYPIRNHQIALPYRGGQLTDWRCSLNFETRGACSASFPSDSSSSSDLFTHVMHARTHLGDRRATATSYANLPATATA